MTNTREMLGWGRSVARQAVPAAGRWAMVLLVSLCSAAVRADEAAPAANLGASASMPAAGDAALSVRYCNQPSVLIRYRWQGETPAGVQMWITLDGQVWLPWQWSDKPGEPIAFAPPRQGKVAIALAAASQETAALPESGYQVLPLVFDWDKPLVRLTAARQAGNGPRVQLAWAAWDENLGDRPVSIHWRAKADEPWRLGAADLPNSGAYDWQLPAEAAGQDVEVNLRVTDLAGNIGEGIGPIERPARPAVAAKVPTSQTQPLAAASGAATPATQQARADTRPSTGALEAGRLAEMARLQIAQNDLEAAESLLREALEADPVSHSARLQLAILLQKRGRVPQAITEYQAVLAVQPDSTMAWRNLALAYMATKDYPKARVTLQKLLAVEPTNAQTWLDLGDVEMLSSRPDSARQAWEKARSMSPANSELAAKASKRLAVFLRQK